MNKEKTIILCILCLLCLLPHFAFTQTLEEADKFCDKGIELYREAEFRQAVLMWEKALNVNPDHKLANYYLIRCTREKNNIDNHMSLALENYEEMEYKKSLEHFNIVFEYDIKNEIATRYVKRIGEKLDQTPDVKEDIVNEYKEKGQEYKEKDDPVSIKKTLAVYNIASLLNPDDEEARNNRIEFEKRLPEAFKKESILIYVKIGDEYFNEKKYDEAIYIWRKALTLDPARIDIEDKIIRAFKLKLESEKQEQIKRLMEQGEEYLESGLTQSALVIFEEILRLDPDNQKAMEQRNKLLQQKKKMEEEKNLLTQIDAYMDAAKKNMGKGKFEQAIELLNNVLVLDENHQEAKKQLLLSEQELRKQEEKVKEEEIESIQKFLEQGIIHYKMKEFEKAISLLEECLKLSPGNKFALEYLNLAKKALWAKKQEEVDITSPFYNMVHNMIKRGIDFFKQKEYQKSVKIWKSILFIFPLNKVSREYIVKCSRYLDPKLFTLFIKEHIDFGQKYLQDGLKEFALKEFELVKELFPEYKGIDDLIKKASPEKVVPPDPKIVDQYYKQGLSLYAGKKYGEAIKKWEKVLALDPSHEKAKLNINKVDHILNYDRIKARRVSATKDREKVNTYYFKGLKLYNSGKINEAIQMWEMVLKLDPGNIKAKNNIRTCKRVLKMSR